MSSAEPSRNHGEETKFILKGTKEQSSFRPGPSLGLNPEIPALRLILGSNLPPSAADSST